MSIINTTMTIESTKETTTALDLGEGSLDLFQHPEVEGYTPAFPPISDSIDFIKDVDWQDVRRRCRAGINNVGLVIAIIGEKLHDAGYWLANV
jgi:hypothetical protein